ncbi:MAG: hypothetical protein Q7W05_04595 [Deltaproteobacteria bacterium]|nr:hypothetical protein [Deltaproteobacteria bacterium]
MARWLIRLEGENFDLEEFSYWFPDGEICAMTDNGSTYLTGPGFNALTDARKVHEAALVALDECFAIVSLLQSNVRRPNIGAVVREEDDGSKKGCVFGSARLVGRSKMHVKSTIVGADMNLRVPTQAQVLLGAVNTDRHIQMAISLWGDSHSTWPRLYRILEELEASLGMKVHEAQLCSRTQRSRFTRSANAAEVSGHDARHAGGRYQPPSDPMTFDEARRFVAELSRLVLQTAANITSDGLA